MASLAIPADRDDVSLPDLHGEALFTELYRRHGRQLYRYCLGILRHPDDAQDAVQATMMRAFAALERREAPASWRNWLFSIAHNEAVDQLRRRRRHEDLGDAEQIAGSCFEGRLEQRERLAIVLGDLERLSERQRSALLLRELRGMTDEEIGDVLGIPSGGVRQAVFEARSALKDLASGRELSCVSVRTLIAAGDGRRLRGRPVRAHLRACSDCRGAHRSARAARRAAWSLPIWLHDVLARLPGGHGASAAEAIGGMSVAAQVVLVVAAAGTTVGAGVAVQPGPGRHDTPPPTERTYRPGDARSAPAGVMSAPAARPGETPSTHRPPTPLSRRRAAVAHRRADRRGTPAAAAAGESAPSSIPGTTATEAGSPPAATSEAASPDRPGTRTQRHRPEHAGRDRPERSAATQSGGGRADEPASTAPGPRGDGNAQPSEHAEPRAEPSPGVGPPPNVEPPVQPPAELPVDST